MNKKIQLFLTLGIITILIFPKETFAVEKFWYKGASYSSIAVEEDYNKYSDLGLSTVIASAAATFDGGGGKVRVRGWTRDSIIKNYYDANWVYTQKMTIGFAHPSWAVSGLVGMVSPNESTFSTNIPSLHWAVEVFNLVYAITKPITGYVKHEREAYNRQVEVTFGNIGSNATELPSSITYKDAEATLNKAFLDQSTKSGVSAYFEYNYNPGSNKGDLRAWTKAYYVYGKEVSPGMHAVIGVRTGNATVNFTINNK
ncbi:hypothetical protein UACE39S_03211 [Ureibacillus acetophenoni]